MSAHPPDPFAHEGVPIGDEGAHVALNAPAQHSRRPRPLAPHDFDQFGPGAFREEGVPVNDSAITAQRWKAINTAIHLAYQLMTGAPHPLAHPAATDVAATTEAARAHDGHRRHLAALHLSEAYMVITSVPGFHFDQEAMDALGYIEDTQHAILHRGNAHN